MASHKWGENICKTPDKGLESENTKFGHARATFLQAAVARAL